MKYIIYFGVGVVTFIVLLVFFAIRAVERSMR